VLYGCTVLSLICLCFVLLYVCTSEVWLGENVFSLCFRLERRRSIQDYHKWILVSSANRWILVSGSVKWFVFPDASSLLLHCCCFQFFIFVGALSMVWYLVLLD
jgi:hypothetical protein